MLSVTLLSSTKPFAFSTQTLLALLTVAMAASLRVVLSRPTTPTHFLKSLFRNPNHCSRTMNMTTSSSSLEIWPGVQSENPFQVSGRTDAQFYVVDHHRKEIGMMVECPGAVKNKLVLMLGYKGEDSLWFKVQFPDGGQYCIRSSIKLQRIKATTLSAGSLWVKVQFPEGGEYPPVRSSIRILLSKIIPRIGNGVLTVSVPFEYCCSETK